MAEATGVKLKCSGAYSAYIEIDSLLVTVGALKEVIADGMGSVASNLKVIHSGRNLLEDGRTLDEYGIKAGARLLVMRGAASPAVADLAAQEKAAAAAVEHAQRLERLKRSAEALAGRGNGRGASDGYEFALENQAGVAVQLSEDDRCALVTGLALHEKAKKTLAKGDHKGALEELLLAEEAFDLCRSDIVDSIDNVGLLLLDLIWCLFMLRQVSQLAAGQARLVKARKCLERSHGTGGERLRVLHGNFRPELATYVRLELLEGVSAWHAGNPVLAEQRLRSAEGKWRQLQVVDESLASLASMGFSTSESTRALRFCSGDVQAAAAFVLEQRAGKERRKAEDRRLKHLRSEAEQYGRTPKGKSVDMEAVENLHGMGYDRSLCAEALRQAENDTNTALDAMVDPTQAESLQLAVVQTAEDTAANEAAATQLVTMGFKRYYATRALRHSTAGDVVAAVELLTKWGQKTREAEVHAETSAPGQGVAVQSAGVAASGAVGGGETSGRERHRSSPQQTANVEVSEKPDDMEADDMETEIVDAARHNDPLSAYDVSVSEEGIALKEYLALVEAANGVL